MATFKVSKSEVEGMFMVQGAKVMPFVVDLRPDGPRTCSCTKGFYNERCVHVMAAHMATR